jgi:hypothetical protein
MASSYPGGYDTLPDPAANLSGPPLHSTMHNAINDAIEAIQHELGLDPSGADATVAALLAALPSRYLPLTSAWTAFTPVVVGSGGNPNLGTTGTTVAAWVRMGKTILWRAVFTAAGTGITAGTGTYSVAPPVTPVMAAQILGQGWVYNTSTGFWPFIVDGSNGRLIGTKDGANISATTGLNGAGAALTISGSYEGV